MIIFLHYGQHTITHQKIEGQRGIPPLRRWSYQWLLRRRNHWPRATYVFTDRERMDPWEQRVYAAAFRHINSAGAGYRAINDPARMLDRPALLRQLYLARCNDFNAYRVTERQWPERYPVFIRRAFDHYQPLSGLLADASELRLKLQQLSEQGEPEEGLLITEYCSEPVADKLFRKLSSYRIGERVFFHSTVHERNWLVKYGELNAASDELYREEADMIRDNAFSAELSRAFDIGGIEYGRADFGLVNANVQTYEINTNPTIAPPAPHPNSLRAENMQAAWELYCDALQELDTTDPTGPRAAPFRHPEIFSSMLKRWRYGTRFKR